MASAALESTNPWERGGPGADVPRIDLEFALETPENAVLTYQLAGPASRLLAYLIDLVVLALIYILGTCLIPAFLTALGLPSLGVGILLILWFALQWIYFVLLEWIFRGKTVGKHLMGLRVMMDGGYPLTFLASVLRNFLRAADCMPFFGLNFSFLGAPWLEIPLPVFGVGLLAMLMTREFRRAGDVVARTVVISEGRKEAVTVHTGAEDSETIVVVKQGIPLPQEPIILDKITPLNRSQIGGYSPTPRTLALIEQFLGRRYALTYRRGHDMAAVLARVLAARMNYEGDQRFLEKYPMAFLASVYATFHRTLDEDGDD